MNSKEYINYMYQAAVNTNELFGVGWVTGEVEDIFDFYSLGTDWRQCLNTEFGGQGSDQCVVDTDWQSLAFQDAKYGFTRPFCFPVATILPGFFVSGHYSRSGWYPDQRPFPAYRCPYQSGSSGQRPYLHGS